MAPLKAADALAALQAAGIDAHKAPAPAGVCRTCCYRVAGQPVNLGRLRQLGADALAAKAAADATPSPDDRAAAVVDHLVRKFPVSTPETYRAAVARLQDRGALITPGAVLREMERPALPPVIVAPEGGPVLPGETVAPATPKRKGPAPELPALRADAAAGRPVSLAALARAIADDRAAARAAYPGPVGQPWDPGIPAARARVADRQARAVILWEIAQAARGAGVAVPSSWASDGPAMAGDWPLPQALAVVSTDALRAAAVALAALATVTTAQADALALCRAALSEASRPYV